MRWGSLTGGIELAVYQKILVMPGLDPRLSGSVLVPLDRELSGVEDRAGFGLEEAVDAPAVHEIDADQSGEGAGTLDAFLHGLGEAQHQEGDERDRDLDAHGILGSADEARDSEGLLDPAEEQFDGPASP